MNTKKTVFSKLAKTTKKSINLSKVAELRKFAEFNSFDQMNFQTIESASSYGNAVKIAMQELNDAAANFLSDYEIIESQYFYQDVANNIETLVGMMEEVRNMYNELGVDPNTNEDFQYAQAMVGNMEEMANRSEEFFNSYDYLVDTINNLGY